MSLIGHLIKGSPLDKWLFSDPPKFVVESPRLWARFSMSINKDLSRILNSKHTFLSNGKSAILEFAKNSSVHQPSSIFPCVISSNLIRLGLGEFVKQHSISAIQSFTKPAEVHPLVFVNSVCITKQNWRS